MRLSEQLTCSRTMARWAQLLQAGFNNRRHHADHPNTLLSSAGSEPEAAGFHMLLPFSLDNLFSSADMCTDCRGFLVHAWHPPAVCAPEDACCRQQLMDVKESSRPAPALLAHLCLYSCWGPGSWPTCASLPAGTCMLHQQDDPALLQHPCGSLAIRG